jgi:hypothetical protein
VRIGRLGSRVGERLSKDGLLIWRKRGAGKKVAKGMLSAFAFSQVFSREVKGVRLSFVRTSVEGEVS